MIGNGTYGQSAGTITDDTELALCIARSLVENQSSNGEDIAARFVEWVETESFDIGLMIADALRRIQNGAS